MEFFLISLNSDICANGLPLPISGVIGVGCSSSRVAGGGPPPASTASLAAPVALRFGARGFRGRWLTERMKWW